jgi:hypothetical protein
MVDSKKKSRRESAAPKKEGGLPVLLFGGVGCGLLALLFLCGGGIGLAIWIGTKDRPGGILGGGGKANVSKENLHKIEAGMPLEEVNAILGSGRVANQDHMSEAFGNFGLDASNKWIANGNNAGVDTWRQWQADDQSIFVGFGKGLKSGKEFVLISFWVKRKANGFASDVGVLTVFRDDPDTLAAKRDERVKLLSDPKWKGDRKARIVSKWHDEVGNGYEFKADGSYARLGFGKYNSTYRFTADDQIEITIPAGAEIVGAKARTETYKIWVSEDELLMQQQPAGKMLLNYRRVN